MSSYPDSAPQSFVEAQAAAKAGVAALEPRMRQVTIVLKGEEAKEFQFLVDRERYDR